MCLIAFAWQREPGYPLVLLANRDEFHARPARPVRFWEDNPMLLAGRDEQEGGAWLGVTRTGRWAALTNYREPGGMKAGEWSRGKLVADFLNGSAAPLDFARSVMADGDRYNGFNLLVGTCSEAAVVGNRGTAPQPLLPGLYGLSNRVLDTPWPKTVKLKAGLADVLAGAWREQPERLLTLLEDAETPPDEDLPDTGVGLVWERLLGTAFIRSPLYGTRASSMLLLGEGRGRLLEQVWTPDGPGGRTDIGFALEP